MKILIDIGHPAHVHLFKHFAWEMQKKGHQIFFTCREKEFEIYLLEKYGFEYKSFGKKYSTKLGKIWGLIEFDIKEFFAGLKFKPDIFLSHGSIYAAHASFLLRKPHISLEDSENMEQIMLYKPFTALIISPKACFIDLGKKHIKYEGFHQSTYLRSEYYKPDNSIYNLLELKENEPFFLLRFVGLNATHDYKLKSTTWNERKEIIRLLEKYGKVFISSEKNLPLEFQKYRLPDIPDRIIDIIYYTNLLIGESGAMTNEAAFLGTPNLLLVNIKLGVHEGYKKLGLKFHYNTYNVEVLNKISNILENNDQVKSSFRSKSIHYQNKSINLVEFLIWIVENIPYTLDKKFVINNYKWKKYVQ